MKKMMKKSILICCILLCICVYPLCLVRRDVNVDPALDGKYQFTDSSGQELKQYFAAQTAYLSGVAFDIIFPDGKPDDGELLVRVSEEGGRVIEEKQIALSAVNDGAFTAVSFGRWIKKGSLYMLEILGGVIAVFRQFIL